MSAFLGKIHFLLYNKIQLHEKLLKEILSLAEKKGFDCNLLVEESYLKFGHPIVGSLENEIDNSNIHGWLQERIISVEKRLAYIITKLLHQNVINMDEISEIFYKNAVTLAEDVDIEGYSPQEIFKLIFDYMLEGMPCDRINEVIESDDNLVKWRSSIDIHEEYWKAIDGDINNFHLLRDAWINGLLSKKDVNCVYVRNKNLSIIKRV